MGNKRSIGVTIFALMIIVLSSIFLVCSIIGYKHQIQASGILLFLLTILLTIGYLISGIFLFRLMESGRKAVVYLSIINILLIPLYVFAEVKLEEPNIRSHQIEIQKRYGPVITNDEKQLQAYNGPDDIKNKAARTLSIKKTMVNEGDKIVTVTWSIFMSLILLIFNLIPIFFFTRRKVKEQFIGRN